MPKLSIVVPVYNVEKYLERCVSSILFQSFSDWELILVDDGSPDNCPALCDQYAEKDKRIRVIHKKNGGLSSARNAGLKEAIGEYVGFVDSDDSIKENMYSVLVETIERYNTDFVMSDYMRIPATGEPFHKTLNIREGLYTKQDIVNDIYPCLIMGKNMDHGPLLSVCHCLYNRSFLNDHGVVFDEEVRWSEDNIFSAFVGYHAQSFYYLKTPLYNYYQNEGTISTSYRKGSWKYYLTMNRHLHEFFDRVGDYDFTNQLKLHLLYYACNSSHQPASFTKKERYATYKEILETEELREAFRNVDLSEVYWKTRIQLATMKYRLYGVLDKILMRGGN